MLVFVYRALTPAFEEQPLAIPPVESVAASILSSTLESRRLREPYLVPPLDYLVVQFCLSRFHQITIL